MDKGASYYNDVTQGSSVREKEFLKNEDWTEVKGTIYASLVPDDIRRKGEGAARNYISEHYEDVSKFLSRLEAVGE